MHHADGTDLLQAIHSSLSPSNSTYSHNLDPGLINPEFIHCDPEDNFDGFLFLLHVLTGSSIIHAPEVASDLADPNSAECPVFINH